jgi:hypothetical protein
MRCAIFVAFERAHLYRDQSHESISSEKVYEHLDVPEQPLLTPNHKVRVFLSQRKKTRVALNHKDIHSMIGDLGFASLQDERWPGVTVDNASVYLTLFRDALTHTQTSRASSLQLCLNRVILRNSLSVSK